MTIICVHKHLAKFMNASFHKLLEHACTISRGASRVPLYRKDFDPDVGGAYTGGPRCGVFCHGQRSGVL